MTWNTSSVNMDQVKKLIGRPKVDPYSVRIGSGWVGSKFMKFKPKKKCEKV